MIAGGEPFGARAGAPARAEARCHHSCHLNWQGTPEIWRKPSVWDGTAITHKGRTRSLVHHLKYWYKMIFVSTSSRYDDREHWIQGPIKQIVTD
jgi:hypothetical protein